MSKLKCGEAVMSCAESAGHVATVESGVGKGFGGRRLYKPSPDGVEESENF